MVKAQEWLDKEYPLQKRSKVAELDISKGKVKRWDGHERTLKGDLKLLEFTNLKKLIISGHELTDLDITRCPNLEELDCQNNQLTNLNVKDCTNLKKINCSNSKIKKLDFSTCPKLEEVELSSCPEELVENKQAIKSDDLIFNIEKDKLVKGPNITSAEDSIRNILIVGWTGSGKSSLANALTDTEKFKSSSAGVSKTDKFQTSEIFEWESEEKKAKYRIIDNIGFGDTRKDVFSEEEILNRIGEGIISAKEGINQILFVVRGRFTKENIETFKRFERSISETGITKFTTVIKTDFLNFRDLESCEKDKEDLKRETKDLRKIIESCKEIIHIDNPPIIATDSEKEINSSKAKRKLSREKILNHLVENCSEIYKLREWDDLYSMIVKYKEIENNLNNAKDEREKAEIEKVRKSWFKELKVKLGVNVPGLPVSANVEVGVLKY